MGDPTSVGCDRLEQRRDRVRTWPPRPPADDGTRCDAVGVAFWCGAGGGCCGGGGCICGLDAFAICMANMFCMFCIISAISCSDGPAPQRKRDVRLRLRLAAADAWSRDIIGLLKLRPHDVTTTSAASPDGAAPGASGATVSGGGGAAIDATGTAGTAADAAGNVPAPDADGTPAPAPDAVAGGSGVPAGHRNGQDPRTSMNRLNDVVGIVASPTRHRQCRQARDPTDVVHHTGRRTRAVISSRPANAHRASVRQRPRTSGRVLTSSSLPRSFPLLRLLLVRTLVARHRRSSLEVRAAQPPAPRSYRPPLGFRAPTT